MSEKALVKKTETSPTAVSAADARRLDLMTNSALARMSMSLSPQTSLLALMDWASHLASSPGRQMQLLDGQAPLPQRAQVPAQGEVLNL